MPRERTFGSLSLERVPHGGDVATGVLIRPSSWNVRPRRAVVLLGQRPRQQASRCRGRRPRTGCGAASAR